jgi:hypothetical protein
VRCLLAALLSALSCQHRPAAPAPAVAVTLFFTAELKGYVGPCGCSENMRGGLARLANVVERTRQPGMTVGFFDVGDALFGSDSIAPEALAQQERKAACIAEAFRTLKLDGRQPGKLDSRYAPALSQSLPLLTTQWVTAGEAKAAVVGGATLSQATERAIQARAQGASFVAGVVLASFEALVKEGLVENSPFDLLVAGEASDGIKAEVSRQLGRQTKVVQLQSKGRTLLRVDLQLRPGQKSQWHEAGAERQRELDGLDERIERLKAQVNDPGLGEQLKTMRQGKLVEVLARRASLANTGIATPPQGSLAQAVIVPIELTLPEDAAVSALVQAYDRDVGVLNLAWAKEHGRSCETPSATLPGYVGSAACEACHAPAFAVFRDSKHSQAYPTLRAKEKQYHLDCIGCHVTGWRQPGGVCRIDETQGREEVGCESCHGPGSVHVGQPVVQTIRRGKTPATCTGCHDAENSPHFDFERYLARILGPGHGAQ